MENIVDRHCWEDHRKVLTPVETGIPALRTFGICSRNRAGQPLRPHIHKDCMEIVYLVKGFQFYETGNTHYNLSGSDVFVVYPDEVHSSGGYPESACDLIWMQICLTEALPFFGLDQSGASQLRAALSGLPRQFNGDSALRAQLTEAFFALSKDDPFEQCCGQQLLSWALFRMVRLSRKQFVRKSDTIGAAIAYIHDNLSEQISLESAAERCGLSLSWFKIKFKEEVGCAPREYINYAKIQRAKQLLESGRSVTDTALDLSFTTANYFSVIFKKYTGLTPSQYIGRNGG